MASTKDEYSLPQTSPPYDPVRLVSPTEYSYIEGLERNYELQGNTPIDGSKQELRAYSPFKISIVPPHIYENVPEQRGSQKPQSVPQGEDNEITTEGQRLLQELLQKNQWAIEQGLVPSSSLPGLVSNFSSQGLVGHQLPVGEIEAGLTAQERRSLEEVGQSTAYSQVRRVGGQAYDLKTISVASQAYNSFQKAKDAYARGVLRNLGSEYSLGGFDRDKIKSFIAQGKERFADGTALPALADHLVAADIALQLEGFMKTPPLTLLVNPTSLSISYEKVQQYSNRSRFGYIYEAWGEQQPKLSISGQIGAFIAGSSDGTSPSGVQFASKRDSAAYQNLMNLFSIYKNGGYIHDTIYKSKSPHFIGALAIEYDGWTYIGHMENFNYGFEEKETQNGSIQFDFEFTVSQMYDSDQPIESVQQLSNPNQGPPPRQDRAPNAYSGQPPLEEGISGAPPEFPEAQKSGGASEVPPSSGGFKPPDPDPEAQRRREISLFGQTVIIDEALTGTQGFFSGLVQGPDGARNVDDD